MVIVRRVNNLPDILRKHKGSLYIPCNKTDLHIGGGAGNANPITDRPEGARKHTEIIKI